MKVSLAPKEFKKDTLVLSIDDEPWKEIHMSIFWRRPTLLAPSLSVEEWKEAFYCLEFEKAKLFAIKRLSYKSYHTVELKAALESHYVSSSNTQRLIEEFTHLGYLNDQDWLMSFLRAQLRRKIGVKNILMKLKMKGISCEDIPDFMKELDYSPHLSIQKLLETKFRHRNLNDYKEKQKVIASLVRKGFDFADIMKAFQQKGESVDFLD